MTPKTFIPSILFRMDHPYVLADGRRFASLACAAASALHDGDAMFPILDERTDREYYKGECLKFGALSFR
jgi:hypothetical protein